MIANSQSSPINTDLDPPAVDFSKKWYTMLAVGMGIFLATIDGSIVNVALPSLTRSLETDFTTIQWVVLAYLLTVTTLMLSVGRLADIKGKKPLYTLGFAIFTAGSVLCGLSQNVYALIAFRVLQAFGAAMIMALGTAIITEAFPASERGKALGISGTIVSFGIVLGPTLGGLLLHAFSWHWIFFVNLPVGILGILLVIRYVPNLRPSGEQRFDFIGAGALFASLLSLLVALTLGQRIGFLDSRTIALFISWLVFLVLFIWIERRVTQPMIDLHLFENQRFSINLITGFLMFVALSGTLILMPFYLENILGYDTRQVGLLLAVVPITLGIISPISGALSDRYGTRRIAVIGLFFATVGYLALTTLNSQTSALGYIVRFFPIGLGIGIFQSPNNSDIMGSAPRHRLGIASGMLAVTRTLGQTTGIAVLGAIWSSSTLAQGGFSSPGGATTAPVAAQIAALQVTLLVTLGLVTIALSLGILALILERRRAAQPSINPANIP